MTSSECVVIAVWRVKVFLSGIYNYRDWLDDKTTTTTTTTTLCFKKFTLLLFAITMT